MALYLRLFTCPHEKTRPAKTARQLTGVEWPVKVLRSEREGSSKSLMSNPATTRVLSSGDRARQWIGSGLALKIETSFCLATENSATFPSSPAANIEAPELVQTRL